MLDDEGQWLKLMRKAHIPNDANICLRITGREIVCTVTKDVNKDVELKVTCLIADKDNEEKSCDTTTSMPKSPASSLADSSSHQSSFTDGAKRESSPTISQSSPNMLDSLTRSDEHFDDGTTSTNFALKHETLEEDEQTHNQSSSDGDESSWVSDANSRDESCKPEPSCFSDKKSNQEDKRRNLSNEEASHLALPLQRNEQKTISSKEFYKCPICKFFCYQPSTYEKHVKCHFAAPLTRSPPSITNTSSYCHECKIQFMSVKTYQSHKQYYCKSRHESEKISTMLPESALHSTSDALILNRGLNGSATSSVIQPQAIFAAISTNPLILLPCSLVSGQNLVPQNGVISATGSGFVLQARPRLEKTETESSDSKDTEFRKATPLVTESVSDSSRSLLICNAKSSKPTTLLKRKMSEGDVLNRKKFLGEEMHTSSSTVVLPHTRESVETSPTEQETPLDLSLKRRKVPFIASSRRRRHSSASNSQLTPPLHFEGPPISSPGASMLTSSRSAISPLSVSSDTSCHASQVSVGNAMMQRLSPSPSVLPSGMDKVASAIPPISMPPPKVVKQGNNICEECHIVFYKYDNYLAHKKHYCAFRRQQLSALAAAAAAAAAASPQDHSSDDSSSNHSGMSEAVKSYPSEDPVPKPAVTRTEFSFETFRPAPAAKPSHTCDACGVKFSSSDNLNAHQTYYCIKKGNCLLSKSAACSLNNKDGGESSSKGLEVPLLGPEEWKCNYCDATCSSYETIRRHLLTHTELRGFRCIICGYKGNTLRGMRTHACEHLNGDTASIEEFVTSMITESGGIPVMSRTSDGSEDDSESSKEVKTIRVREPEIISSTPDRMLLKQEPITIRSSESESPLKAVLTCREITYCEEKSPKAVSQNDDIQLQGSLKLANFADMVIKKESERSGNDEDSSNESLPGIKRERDTKSDIEERQSDASPVICGASDDPKSETMPQVAESTKRGGKVQSKSNTELKYCKSCDISFYHLSNFIAHKKYYCVSRVLQNFHQETAPVQ